MDSDERRGVILLIVMALLSLMTLMGLTLVLVTAQGRLSALAASRNTLQSEHDTEELTYARIQVIAGSADPNSSFGAHGLIEDLYGLPQFFGQIMRNDTGVPSVVPLGETGTGAAYLAGGNNGALLQLLVTAGNVNSKSGAPIGSLGAALQSTNQYVLPQNSGAFCGQVVTMLTGPAAGQSARVVGYYYNAAAAVTPPVASMQVSSFGGVVPNPGDQFMINGRPFSGTGFGLDLTKFYSGTPGVWGQSVGGVFTATTGLWSGGNAPLLSAIESVAVNAQTPSQQFYAYLPNHSRLALSGFSMGQPGYWDLAGPGGANEPYDAPDFQNMMLAMHYYSPFLLPVSGTAVPVPVGVITPIPSLHRPELVAWFYNQALVTKTPGISMALPGMRRKVILRPEPTDNYFVDTNGNGVWDAREPWHDVNGNGKPDFPPGTLLDVYNDGTPAFLDLNGDGSWTPGEVDYSGNTFNPVTGCWYIAANGGWAFDTAAGLDVDNDKDGTPDSIWVDGGLPAHTESDGTLTKNLISVLCIDLDGKVNLNAHGTLAQLDTFRYPGNNINGPMAGAGGTAPIYGDALFQRNAPVGQGYGPADVNPLHLFVRSHSPAGSSPIPTYTYSNGTTAIGVSGAAHKYYRTFLQGYDYQTWLQGNNGIVSGITAPVMQVDGRYGESARLTVPPAAVAGFNFPGVFPPGSYNPSYLSFSQQILNGPRAGWSQWFDPFSTSFMGGAYWVNDPVALARFSDVRPGLLTPPSLSGTPFFFDFLDSYLPGTTTPAAIHVPTGHGTPSDFHSRGILTTDFAGRPYYAGTLTFPWQVMGLAQPFPTATGVGIGWQPTMPPFTNFYSAVMTDFAASEYGLAVEAVMNEAVDTQYEMDLTQGARQTGQNTGNTTNAIPDFATVDAKLSPTELEGILRTYEQGASGTADSSSLLQRLNNLETANSLSSTPLYSLLANKDTTIPSPPTKISPRNDIRLAVTTESWDLPMPNLALTPRQMQDVVQYADFYESTALANWLANPLKILNLNNIGLVDLARTRLFAENYDVSTGTLNAIIPMLSVVSGADTSLFGNLKNIQLNVGTMPGQPVWPLLAPETVLGMRLDVNRALGNGVDDNGNGVVDEPLEVFVLDTFGRGEHLIYPYSQINPGASGPAGQINNVNNSPALTLPNGTKQNDMIGILDLNNDGFYPQMGLGGPTSIDPQLTAQTGTNVYLPADPTGADSRARQLLAKHLYCLAMLLLDDRASFTAGLMPIATNPNYGIPGSTMQTAWPFATPTTQNIMAQIFNTAGPMAGYYALQSLPTGISNYETLGSMPREQAAYVIAQWAVNVVDFRDRDSIMTPFEFDIYPFRADPYVTADPSLLWVQAAEMNLTWNVDDIIDPINPAYAVPWSHHDDLQAYRGLVWGCERPELLMTETVAFHDRGTADTSGAEQINDSAQTPAKGPDTTTSQTTSMPYDKDFDQVRRPRGSLVVELFNPTSYSDAPQADMQQPFQVPDGNFNRGMGVNLAQVAQTGVAVSPVWRIVVAYSPWQSSQSMCYGNPPNGLSTATGYYVGGGGSSNSPVQPGAMTATYIDPRVPVLPPSAIHRAVYFTPFNPAFVIPGTGGVASLATVNDTLLNNSFFADSSVVGAPNLLVPPGQYALVGPANLDPAGTGTYNIYAGQNTMTGGNAYPWKLQLAFPGAALLTPPQPMSIAYLYTTGGAPQGPYGPGYTGVTATSTSIKPVIGVPIQTNWYTIATVGGKQQAVFVPHNLAAGTVPAGAAISTTLRMSISEPEHGYPVWYGGAITTATSSGATPPSLQDDATYSAAGFGSFPQHPYDSAQGTTSGGNYLQFGDLPNPCVAPSGSVGTTLGYTVLYLQRLADPLHAWDHNLNPYITVDSMPVDLTSYTGETGTVEPPTYYTTSNPINAPSTQPQGYSSWTASGGTNASFDTRRRGYSATGDLLLGAIVPQAPLPNIWTPLPITVSTNPYTVTTVGSPIALPPSTFTYNKFGNNGLGTLASPMSMSIPTSSGGLGTFGSTLGFANWEYSFLPATGTGSSVLYTADSAPGTTTPVPGTSTSGMPAYMYNGDPTLPFPWLTWNNRPYVSQFELMLVPASSPSSQLRDFGMLGWALAGSTMNEYQPYAPSPGGSALTPIATMLPAAQFMQLLNFFNNEQTLSPTETTIQVLLPNLYRVFEFLQVPSRYTGTQDLLNPSQFAGDDAISTAAGFSGMGFVNTSVSHLFHPPFNWLPRYREPGKINLNTVFDPVVFQSLMDDYPGSLYANIATDLNPITGLADAMVWPRGLYAAMTQSRQGFYTDPMRPYMLGAVPLAGPYTVNSLGAPVLNPSAPPNPISQFAFNTTGGGTPGINADVPTYFANPFRPDGAAAFVPPTDVLPPGVVPPVSTTKMTVPPYPINHYKLMHQWSYPGGSYNGVNATLLRSQDVAFNSSPIVVNEGITTAGAPTPGPLALFDDTAFDTNNLGTSYLSTATTTPAAVTQYRNPAQNATFEYQMFTRLGNTATNRSNVYAIWITLGKFEVQPVAPSPTNPDGYKLVKPYLNAQGNQVQTRGFYIFDRSIPMGFQRGQDINIEKGMLVERVLESP